MDATNTRLRVEDQHIRQRPRADVQRMLITHAVLIGLTHLVPVPVLGNQAKGCFRKHLVRGLAATEGRVLTESELNALAAGSKGPGGFLRLVLAYPAKMVFPMLFYSLDLKQAANLASRTYLFGYLVGYAMQSGARNGSLLDIHGAHPEKRRRRMCFGEATWR